MHLSVAGLPCFCAIFRDGNLIAPTFQPTLQSLAKHRIVFCDQNSIACRSRLLQCKGLGFREIDHGLTQGDSGAAWPSELIFWVTPIDLSNRAIDASNGSSRVKAP